jgi:hypothetical protein
VLGDDQQVNPPAMLVALRPLEIKQLFDFAIRIYRQRFPAMLLAMSIVQLPISLAGVAVMIKFVSLATEVQRMTQSGLEPDSTWLLDNLDSFILLGAFMLGSAAYQMLVTPLGMLTCSRLATCALHGSQPSLSECFHYSLKRYWPTQVAIAVFGLPLVGLAVVALILVLVGQAIDSTGLMVTGAILGFALIFLGSLAMLLAYFRLFPALIGIIQSTEDLPPGSLTSQGMWLIQRAWELTAGQFFRVLGLSILAFFSIYVINRGISEMVNTIISLVFEVMRGTQGEDIFMNLMFQQPDPMQLGLSMTLIMIFSMIFPPFLQAYQLMLYYDLRCRKEAYDLKLLLDTAELPPAE